ncbi:hypothetical protein CEXT_133361 [Caerostris extrusa]|uniref:Uncharacterized protein n=1 Tax=Caerostris extrusa TaxID=172846 RepID=A0AAV4YC92_CAEEX|nr:hypothetical protein CEXT_133361 [Caerostris extrusa]
MEVPVFPPFYALLHIRFFGNSAGILNEVQSKQQKSGRMVLKAKSPDFPVNGLPDRQTGATQVAQSGTNPLYFQGPPQFKTITRLNQRRELFGVGVLFLAVILLKAVVLLGIEKCNQWKRLRLVSCTRDSEFYYIQSKKIAFSVPYHGSSRLGPLSMHFCIFAPLVIQMLGILNEGQSKQQKSGRTGLKGKSPDFPVNGLPDRQTSATQVAQSGTNPLYFQGPPQFKTITWVEPKTRECCSKRWSKKEMNKKKVERTKGLFDVGVLFSLSFYSRLSFFLVSKKCNQWKRLRLVSCTRDRDENLEWSSALRFPPTGIQATKQMVTQIAEARRYKWSRKSEKRYTEKDAPTKWITFIPKKDPPFDFNNIHWENLALSLLQFVNSKYSNVSEKKKKEGKNSSKAVYREKDAPTKWIPCTKRKTPFRWERRAAWTKIPDRVRTCT